MKNKKPGFHGMQRARAPRVLPSLNRLYTQLHGHAAHRAGPTARAAITQHGLYILRGSPRHVFTPCSVSSCTPHFASRSTSSELGLHLRATLYMVTCQWGPLQPIHRLLSCLAHAGSTARSSRHVFTQRSVTQCLTRGHPRSSMLGHQRAALYPPMRTPSHSQAAVVPRPRSAHAVTCALAQAFSASLLVVRFDHPWQWLWRWNLCWLVHE